MNRNVRDIFTHLNGEVYVAGGVDDVDVGVLPPAEGSRRLQEAGEHTGGRTAAGWVLG